ncbi:MAG: GTPase domain-containing protein [Polyangiaceae bacterium]|nr:GTPase domain-containing protein [Polyangiaceae bacterium]
MPSYDAERGCHIIRIVYDGPGFAGKTTNLQQVCTLLPATKRSELYTPAALKGRTMFFDWMEVLGPPITSVEVRFHLITVPGQIERNYRRRPLVEMADVVVFVCDPTPEQLTDSLRTFARLRGSIKQRGRDVPLVVQANKQDVAGALSPEQVRRRLKLQPEVSVVPASSVSGAGVRETLARSMRLGLQALAAGSDAGASGELVKTADELFDHVLSFEDAPRDDDVLDVEELYVAEEQVDVDAHLEHLTVRALDALESKAKRAVEGAARPATAPQPILVPRKRRRRSPERG